jgi:hypothetical protein
MPPVESSEAEKETDPARGETSDNTAVDARTEKGPAGGGRAGVAIAAVLLLACGGLVGYGLLGTEEEPAAGALPTAEVTYEVTGEGPVEISYLARSEAGTATVEKGVTLPWKKTVHVPLGKGPTVAVVLGEKGGRAVCTLSLRGKHVQRATAMGGFGRATCAGAQPATDN